MAEITGIGWTDKTHNEWWGCSSKAGAGCDRCYAIALDHRFGGNNFGIGTVPRLTKIQNRNKPYRWEREAIASGERIKVFCGSMMDFFDKLAPGGAREEMWQKVKDTPHLDWHILTKRTPNIEGMLPADWGNGYDNVWLGTTVENRRSGLRRMEMLKRIPCKMRFLSIEPLLEHLGDIDLTGIDWVIIGGESGSGCRPMKEEWVDDIVRQAREQGVSVFFKQWGGTDADAGGCVYKGGIVKEFPVKVVSA